ncbi:hypothetical protein, partial [Okeania sp. SIO2B9]|uniref:hypothetical protein n=1 Tax=Okeania sp. SIO2B9 TaxID=2607782 RepID=UPI00142A2D18
MNYTNYLIIEVLLARAEIGAQLLSRITRISGPPCATSANNSSMARLGARLGAPDLAVLRGGFDGALPLPGGKIALARGLVEDHEAPDVAGGYVLAAQTAARLTDPLGAVLDHGGLLAAFRLLTTGQLDAETLDG